MLHVEVIPPNSAETRMEILNRNAQFRSNPTSFREGYQTAAEKYVEQIRAARERLPSITVSPKMLSLITNLTILDNQSTRFDLQIEEISRANCAFEGRNEVEANDVMEAAEYVMMHRLTPREMTELERSGGGGHERPPQGTR